MVEICDVVVCEKCCCGELGFDDMFSWFDEVLCGDSGEMLVSVICQCFLVVMIDEFQDIDFQQYWIFCCIWCWQLEMVLLLIGDFKQVIYVFCGVDIFIYMKVCGDVVVYYIFDINWCFLLGMVGSVNWLFSFSDNFFMFYEILFLLVKVVVKNKGLCFIVDVVDVLVMNVWLMFGDIVGFGDYQIFMVQFCVMQICDWLSVGQWGCVLLWCGEILCLVQVLDIIVLVCNWLEVVQVCEVLQMLGIFLVYFFNCDSVFEMFEVQELFWLLQVVLVLEWENILCSVLVMLMFGLIVLDIENLNQDEQVWDVLVEEFSEYCQIWWQCGVMLMLWVLMIV